MFTNSSSSEDEFEKIREAVDESFLTKDLYSEGKPKEKCETLPKPPPSLRNQNHQEVDNNPFSLKVTPEFQKHVSKHLSKILDELIDDSQVIHKSKKLKQKRNGCNGVKLLSSSEGYLLPIVDANPSETVKKSVRGKDVMEIDYEERAKEVAVSPEWVLSQEETKYWAPNTKGEIEIVKLHSCKNKKKKLR